MKKYIFLLFVIIVGFSANDVQKEIITLDWNETAGEVENDAQVLFENTDFFESGLELPLYTRLYNVKYDNSTFRFVIENPEFELFNGDINALCLDKIPDETKIESKVFKSGTSKKIELQVTPLKKEDGKIFLLKSFELKQIPEELISAKTEINWKERSVFNSGKWVKIKISGKGIYKIPYSKLRDWGFNTPSEVGVFGSGGKILPENPGVIPYDDIEQNAVWTNSNGGEECLFFYAPGFTQWHAIQSGRMGHQLNDYATEGYFFLGEVRTTKKNVELLPEINETPTHTTSSFDECELIENELVNLLGSGKQWFGEKFLAGNNRSFSFILNDSDSESVASIRVNAAARSYQNSSMDVSVNGYSVGAVSFSKVNTNETYGVYANEANGIFEFTASNGQLDLQLNYTASHNAEAWLDYIELNYRRRLTASNNAIFFRDLQSIGEGNIVKFNIGNASSETRIFDVTDLNNLKEIDATYSGNSLSVICHADELKEYVLLNTNGTFPEPEFVADIENQNLHATPTPEYLIISHPNFMGPAQELADFHREYDGMSVEVVNVEKVYNEFSSGSKNATGIRNFIKMHYDKGNTLKYVLLFGDGSYDNKNINPGRNSFIPTYQSRNSLNPLYSFVTDDYFVMLDTDESVYDGAIDLGIGRIPAGTEYEAQLLVDKVKRYYKPDALGDWRNVLCFIGDDEDSGTHMNQSEVLADSINKNHGEFITEKIYLDSHVEVTTPSGDRYPEVNDVINEQVKDGVLVLNYIGHANERFLAHENVLDVSDINAWSNTNQLPIFVTATCEFSRFDADETSAGEYVLLNPNGGGIGLFSTTRVVFSSANFRLSKSFYNFIFEQDENGEHYRMGDVMRLAKTNLGNSTNKRNFTLLADPALKLSYPKYRIVTTSINGQDAFQEPKTIGPLDKVSVTGYVTDYFGNKLDYFNGELIPTVFDKEVEMETLGNAGQKKVKFNVLENVIYKGIASVKNGDFSFSFIIPKDISYSLGEGKIMYYAHNGEEDAHGAFSNFKIGGSGSEVADNKGPEIQLFIDSPDFKSGDKTSKNPTLLANLSDENGINTVGTGIGHDITAVLDDDYSNVFILNNYYHAEMDDYTSGTISFPFKNLAIGTHSLKLKAWDVANNSSEVEIKFEVSGDFYINELSNYPNPLTNYTYFVLEHNQPDATLEAIISIYDINGRKIDEFQTEVGSSGNRTNPIRWDIAELDLSLTAGVYIYNVFIQNSDGVIDSKSGKMIIAN